MRLNGEIAWHQSEQEKKSVVVGSPPQGEAVNFSLPQEVAQRTAASYSCRISELRSALRNKIALRRRKVGIFAGVAIDQVEHQKVSEADEAGGGKTPTPTKIQEQQADQRNSDGGGKFRRRVGGGCCQASFLAGKPVAQGFGVRGKRGRFAHGQKKSRCKDPAEARGDGAGEGGEAPQERADSSHPAHSIPVQQDSSRHLHYGIRPTKGAGEIAKSDQR